MNKIILFAVVMLIAAGLAPRLLDRVTVPPAAAVATARPTAPASAPAVSAGPRKAVLSADARGHFQADGRIDGRRVGFVVDTGATVVALTERDARRLGLDPAASAYVASVRTANGTVKAAPVRLPEVEIGGVSVANVDALVLPDRALSENLLGMSFLSRLRRYEVRDGRMVLEQ